MPAVRRKSINTIFPFLYLVVPFLSIAGTPALLTPPDAAIDDRGFRFIPSTAVVSDLKIDGRLDEEDWRNAVFQGHFLQREPDIGQDATEKTKVAVLRDDNFLYIGVKCFDSEPSKIIAREMRRDARMENDDHFQIVFDTYRDRRNGFYFEINPNGCRRDASFGDEGQSYNSDWDGIWECGARINEEGWFAEVAIPWKTLRFAEEDTATWGINFARIIRRKNEQDFWQLVTRDAGRRGMFRLSQAGSLVGLTGMKAGGNLELEPYLLGGAAKDADTEFKSHSIGDFGIDAKIGLTSNMAMNLTWNTDFAQVEADQERVNLTRFSLYFPEKRDFFLDGAEVFNFGGQSISGRGGPGNGIRLFYSRRIGIEEGNQQPITGGVKLVGKTGKYQIGVMNMLTEEIYATAEDDDEEENGEDEEENGVLTLYPANNFTVLRLRRDLLLRSNVGFMFLNKEQVNSDHYNRSMGVDMNFPLTDVFTISGAFAGTFGPEEIEDDEVIDRKTKNWAGNAELSYNSDLLDLQLSHLSIEDNFDAEMGYVRRTGIRSTECEIEYTPRPKRWPSIRQFRYRLNGEYLTDFGNRMLESQFSASLGISFQNSAYVSLGMRQESEFIDEDWEVRPGYIVPTGTYGGWGPYIWMSSDESKSVVGGLRLSYREYFTGIRLTADPQIALLNFDRFQAEIDVDLNHVEMPEGSFDATTLGCRMYYFFSTKLYLKAYLQWNDDRLANEGDRISLANLLLRWTYRPGSDIYVVYNDRRLFGVSNGEIANRTLMLKATFFWRK